MSAIISISLRFGYALPAYLHIAAGGYAVLVVGSAALVFVR